jgi:hypothetical protein
MTFSVPTSTASVSSWPVRWLCQSAKDQLVAAAAPELGLDEWILLHESAGIGVEQSGGGNTIKLKSTLFTRAIFEAFLPLLRRELVNLTQQRFNRSRLCD